MVKKKAANKSGKAFVGTMTVTANLPEPESTETLAELEKKFDLAGSRLTYALQKKTKWEHEVYTRSQDFNCATIKFKQKKHGFTDAEIIENPLVSSALWTYAK